MSDSASIELLDLAPPRADFRSEVLDGLASSPKTVAPKFFYDQRGSELFERICEVDEYYPTRVETALLEERADEIVELLGDRPLLIEYGSGASRKIRVLLERLSTGAHYLAIDISREHLIDSAEALAQDYPKIDVFAVCGDYSQPLELPADALEAAGKRTVFFPGSTIGNFYPREAREFLRNAARLVGPGGGMLIGVDLKKDRAQLEAAYDDAEGVTAEFNLNLLTRINRELDADFELGAFEHRACYNAEAGRVEMHLHSLADQSVSIGDERIPFAEGETIHTENSYKYAVAEFQRMAADCGFSAERVWTDPNELFSVHFLRAI